MVTVPTNRKMKKLLLSRRALRDRWDLETDVCPLPSTHRRFLAPMKIQLSNQGCVTVNDFLYEKL